MRQQIKKTNKITKAGQNKNNNRFLTEFEEAVKKWNVDPGFVGVVGGVISLFKLNDRIFSSSSDSFSANNLLAHICNTEKQHDETKQKIKKDKRKKRMKYDLVINLGWVTTLLL